MERLRRRAEYVAVAAGIKTQAGAFVLQARAREDAQPARFGFTVARKVGNAPERNRVRRRLREMVRMAAATQAETGYDYVLVGRRAALSAPFSQLVGDFEDALRRVHQMRARQSAADEPDGERRGGMGRRRNGR
jgi:ribonuclease P protein component